jgi:cation/acetate symporter
MLVGTVTTLLLIYLSPTIQVDILKQASAWFPLKNPALVAIPLSFLTGTVVSLLTGSAEEAAAHGKREARIHWGETLVEEEPR